MIHGPIHNAYSLSFNQYAFFYVESDDDKKLVFDLKKMIDEKKEMFQFIIFYSLTNFLRLFLITVFTVAIFEILVYHRIYIYI